jgi:hypothetical protein
MNLFTLHRDLYKVIVNIFIVNLQAPLSLKQLIVAIVVYASLSTRRQPARLLTYSITYLPTNSPNKRAPLPRLSP